MSNGSANDETTLTIFERLSSILNIITALEQRITLLEESIYQESVKLEQDDEKEDA